MNLQSLAIRRFATICTVLSFFVVAGCAGKKTSENTTATPNTEENSLGDSDSGKAMGLETVHFPYDSFVLDGAAKKTLDSNASVLKEKSSLKVQVEGHCDQRGGIQYNIALGEKRAMGVKKYLEDHGVAEVRITTISYGKERLLEQATTEAAYAKNRRANFVITSK